MKKLSFLSLSTSVLLFASLIFSSCSKQASVANFGSSTPVAYHHHDAQPQDVNSLSASLGETTPEVSKKEAIEHAQQKINALMLQAKSSASSNPSEVKLTRTEKVVSKLIAKKMVKKIDTIKKENGVTKKSGLSDRMRLGIILAVIGLILLILTGLIWFLWYLGSIALLIGLVLILWDLIEMYA